MSTPQAPLPPSHRRRKVPGSEQAQAQNGQKQEVHPAAGLPIQRGAQSHRRPQHSQQNTQGTPQQRQPPRQRPQQSRGPPRAPKQAAERSIPSQQGNVEEQEDATPLATTVSTHLSTVRFDSLKGQIDDRLLSAIKFPLMSEVQAATLGPALANADVLAQAKTGTGKTIAFLLPTINRILKQSEANRGNGVSCLIMSPTRELALQIEAEAMGLLKNVQGALGVQHMVGGTNMKAEEKNMAGKRCDILVATPGRLLDHLQNTAGMVPRFKALQVYILDEADRMLDMGFRRELAKINDFLPDRKSVPRQTLLFSATIPDGVREVANLSPNAQFINTLGEDEANTHEHVLQQQLVTPNIADILPLTLALVLEELERAAASAKIIVFAPTARAAGLLAELFKAKEISGLFPPGFTIGEVHSRLSQSQRVKATQEFGLTRRGVLFSSDVAARGVDLPGVTTVLQVGLPASPDQYIHRIGRTGRAGAEGHGIILLADYESYFLGHREMRELPMTVHPGVPSPALDKCRAAVRQALLNSVSDTSKAQAYQASLGYYKSELRGLRWSPDQLVQQMNKHAKEALLFEGGSGSLAPPILAKTVGKMGLRGTAGLNIVRELNGGAQQGRGGSRNPGQTRGGHAGGVPRAATGGEGIQRGAGGGRGGARGFGGRGRGARPNATGTT